jgi:antitoxin CcdA
MAMNRPARFDEPKKPPKKPTNVSLSVPLVDEAKRLGINVSEACQAGLAAEVKKAREKAWQEENRAAIEASNEYVRKHGLPLARYRLF